MTRIFTYDMLHRNGRLGNQLWQIASTIGLATQAQEGDMALFKGWEYRHFFSVPDFHFGPIQPGKVIDGGVNYFQELHYFQEIQDTIREYFMPSEAILEELAQKSDFITDYDHCTALHVRRGDYLKYPDLFPLSTPEYYEAALAVAEETYPGHQVLVFSDDIMWCERQWGYDRGFIYMHGIARPVEVSARRGQPMDFWDLFLMTLCDQHIISNSSFSWWGAWLSANQSPMYPSKWYGPGYAEIPWRLMIPDSWKEIQC